MARPCNKAACEVWRRRFQRFRRSGMSVGRFCSREGVSIASFYYWRKRVGVATSERSALESPGSSVRQEQSPGGQEAMGRRGRFRPVTIASPVPSSCTIASPVPSSCTIASPVSLSCSVASPAPSSRTLDPSASSSSRSSVAGVSIALPCGTRIEIGVGSVDALRAVMVEVMRVSEGTASRGRLEGGAMSGLEGGAMSCLEGGAMSCLEGGATSGLEGGVIACREEGASPC